MNATSRFLRILFPVLLLSLLFATAVGAVAEDAGDGGEHRHCICGGEVSAGDHTTHRDALFSPWDGGDFDFDGEDGNTGTAYLYLTQDVTTGANSCNRTTGSGILDLSSGQTLYLCLNGYSLHNGKTDNNTIDLNTGSKLVLCDCRGGGSVGGRTSGANSGAVWVDSASFDFYSGSLKGSHGVKNGAGLYVKGSGTVRMYAGEITDNTALRQGGGVFLSGSSRFEMFGGKIANNGAAEYGGGIVVDDGTVFAMYDGTIEGNECGGFGGGVFVSGGTFSMNAGAIRKNRAANGGGVCTTYDNRISGTFRFDGGIIEKNYAFGNGGGVYVWDRGTFHMNGGVISENECGYAGGGVCLYTAESSSLKSKLYITGGTIEKNRAAKFGGGVYCYEYSDLTFDGTYTIRIAENTVSDLFLVDSYKFTVTALTDDSSVGVSVVKAPVTEKPTILSAGAVTAEQASRFFSNADGYVLRLNASGTLEATADFTRFTLRYETGDERVTLPSMSVTGFDSALVGSVSSVIPTLPCHEFLGWAETAGASEAAYVPGQEITLTGDRTLYAVWRSLSHTLRPVEKVEPTCTAEGKKAYFVCETCEKRFEGADAAREITDESLLILSPLGHTLRSVEKVEPTCTAEGKKAYFVCETCEKFFEDADATREITDESLLTLPASHRFGAWQEEVLPTTDTVGTRAHRDCEICHKHFGGDGAEIADITLPKLPAATLPSGAVVGITAGSVLLAETGVFSLFWFVIRKKRWSDLLSLFR